MGQDSVVRRWLVVLALVAAACSGGGNGAESGPETLPPTSTSTSTSTTTTTALPTTTTLAPLPAVDTGQVRAVQTSTGVVLPVVATVDANHWRVTTPCERDAVVTGTALRGATIVLDPGHGASETGAAGSNGLVEKDLNLAVATKTKADLEAQGATVVLTRTGDYNLTLKVRAQLALRLGARAFVSIHHNGGADGPSTHPGTETYYQLASPDSKRLAGLLFEEERRFFEGFSGVQWYSNVDAGAKYRRSSTGGDYYGILRNAAGVPAVISEALFLSHSDTEAALLARPDVQQGEADAIARGIRRFLLTSDPGSGFVEPIPRTTPAGPGGGVAGCVDPPLG
jgi:N-acetylmuramoyl-L-alanine amidase